jgi:hypothetical protein
VRGLLAELTGVDPADVQPPPVRPPLWPVRLGTLAAGPDDGGAGADAAASPSEARVGDDDETRGEGVAGRPDGGDGDPS